ncbi:MAG: substrate-binding domain-containing protein, partial [Bifidobacteriaceae bacterium]|nr:substrate-binding domain-containing protein [Bifidobacteriaceae bacterium]
MTGPVTAAAATRPNRSGAGWTRRAHPPGGSGRSDLSGLSGLSHRPSRPGRLGRSPRPFRFRRARLVSAIVGLALVISGLFGPGLAGPIGAGSGLEFGPERALAASSVRAPITGSGSTWSANALQQWITNVWVNYKWKISYSESGSTQGRNDFANGTADFGVSEIPYQIANSNEGDVRPNRQFAYMPIVAGGTALMYNLMIAGKRVTNLRLSGEVVAKIFTGVITRWDDPAIQADNPALALPAIPIVPVVRSDGSGATAQVTIWLRQQYSQIWDAYCGRVGRPMV